MEILRIVNAPVTSNSYIIIENNHALVVDPGTDGSRALLDTIRDKQLTVDHILLTHEHFDHCAGVNSLREATGSPLLCSTLCNELIQNSRGNYSAYWMEGTPFTISAADTTFSIDYQSIWQNHQLYFFIAPGHSKGSIAVIIDHIAMFTGDNYIPSMRTYTNLNGSSKEELRHTLALFHTYSNQANMYVYPGHFDSLPITQAHFNEAARGYAYKEMLQEVSTIQNSHK